MRLMGRPARLRLGATQAGESAGLATGLAGSSSGGGSDPRWTLLTNPLLAQLPSLTQEQWPRDLPGLCPETGDGWDVRGPSRWWVPPPLAAQASASTAGAAI